MPEDFLESFYGYTSFYAVDRKAMPKMVGVKLALLREGRVAYFCHPRPSCQCPKYLIDPLTGDGKKWVPLVREAFSPLQILLDHIESTPVNR